MVATRRARSSSPSEDGDSPIAEVSNTSTAKVPTSDPSRAVKILFSKKNCSSNPVVRVRNPKNASAVLYVISEDSCAEVVQVGEDCRSWFYGDDVIEDGSFRLYSPVHPLFIALPYFFQQKEKFVELGEILTDVDFPALEQLMENKQLLRCLEFVSDTKEICDTAVYRFNQEKTFEWIRGRMEKLRKALLAEDSLHKTITSNAEVLDRFCFGVLCDYLQPEMAALAKEHLGIVDAVVADGERIEMPYKRRAEDEYSLPSQPVAKKPKESAVKKQLAQASKGTKSISSFFGKK